MSAPTPGRRAARRAAPRKRVQPGPASAGAAALVAASALLVAASGLVRATPVPAAAPATVPVDQVTNVCLGSPVPASSDASTLTAPLSDAAGGGSLTVGPAGKPPRTQGPATRGSLQKLPAPGAGSALTVAASGGAAVGRGTFQVDRSRANNALATQDCLQPQPRWWFTGAGAGLDHQSKLVLANVDPGPAVVDVIALGPGGLVDSVGTRGITLQPGEVRTIDLLDVAPQSDELAVHVQASRGRVVAAMADSFASSAGAQPGQEWLPPQDDADRVLRLAPLPAKADGRTLLVANPGGREALVQVEVSGKTGSFPPTDVGELQVPPGAVLSTNLGSALGPDVSGVVIHSTLPVTATVRSSSASDVAYAVGVPVLDGPAAAVLPAGTTGTVHLTAGTHAAKARVVAYSAKGDAVGSGELDVPAGSTQTWTAKRGAGYVVVTPTKGQLFGGVALEAGDLMSQVALRPLPVVLERPVVVPDLR